MSDLPRSVDRITRNAPYFVANVRFEPSAAAVRKYPNKRTIEDYSEDSDISGGFESVSLACP